MRTSADKILHLYSRCGFGIEHEQLGQLAAKDLPAIIDPLFSPQKLVPLEIITREEAEAARDAAEKGSYRTEIKRQLQVRMRELNAGWLKRLCETENVLVEKQTLFWHGLFACRIPHPFLMQELNNTQRKYALASFRDLLHAVSKSPALLIYLDNHRNKKEHPNENFARELLELFTLGRGNYSEKDIRETARAFTGWGFDKKTGTFLFTEEHHDTGEKEIFGVKGNFRGEDVLELILKKKETALFIVRKLYAFYVNESVHEERVKELADLYFKNRFDTGLLLRKIFSSPWFYEPENTGCNIKSPVEFLAVISRQFRLKYRRYEALFKIQEKLGMVLFFPPNVAGWKGGSHFIDSSTLVWRMKLPALLLSDKAASKPEPVPGEDTVDAEEQPMNANPMGVEVNWTDILQRFGKTGTQELMRLLLLRMPPEAVIEKIRNSADQDKRSQILNILSLPEYSLT